MNPEEGAALRDIQGYARANRVEFGPHAKKRMRERGAYEGDVVEALAKARRCTKNKECSDRWDVTGEDLDGDSLTAVVVIEDGIAVVTIFEK